MRIGIVGGLDRSARDLQGLAVNSHNAVRRARRQAKLQNRPCRIMRRLGASQFTALLQALPVAA